MKKLKKDMDQITKNSEEEMLFSKKVSYDTLRQRLYRLQKVHDETKEESEDWYQKWLKVKQS